MLRIKIFGFVSGVRRAFGEINAATDLGNVNTSSSSFSKHPLRFSNYFPSESSSSYVFGQDSFLWTFRNMVESLVDGTKVRASVTPPYRMVR